MAPAAIISRMPTRLISLWPGRDVDVAAIANVAQAAEVGVPAGRLLEPAQLDALGPDGGQEVERLGHRVALVGVDDEQERLPGVVPGV